MKGWTTLFRNRRGGLCTVCCCLVFFVVVTTAVWSIRTLRSEQPVEYPLGLVAAVTALGGVKFGQYRQDSQEAQTAPVPPPAP